MSAIFQRIKLQPKASCGAVSYQKHIPVGVQVFFCETLFTWGVLCTSPQSLTKTKKRELNLLAI